MSECQVVCDLLSQTTYECMYLIYEASELEQEIVMAMTVVDKQIIKRQP